MICEAIQKEALFLSILENTPCIGSRIQTLYDCYAPFPALCRFYIVGETAAMAIIGSAATIAGEVEDTEELEEFLAFLHIDYTEAVTFAPQAFIKERVLHMQYQEVSRRRKKAMQVNRAPDPRAVFSLLKRGGLLDDWEGFYADFCMRRNHSKLLVYTAEVNGMAVATAGIYSLREKEAYLTCVSTDSPYRVQGYASGLCALLAQECKAKKVYLSCDKLLEPIYKKAGFLRIGSLMHASKKE